MSFTIRRAEAADGPALAAVYAPYTETGLTFESPAPTPEEFTARITDTLKGYPFLVCESDGRPVGYAYLEQGCTGRGLGRALYGALLDLLKAQGYVNIYGTVSVPNPPSERLHESMGFRLVYTDLKTGWKLGRWRDLAFYRLQLRPYEDAPAPVLPFPELDEALVRSVCERRAAQIGGGK